MLDPSLLAQLSTAFSRIVQDVELVAALDESPAAVELRALLGELVRLSPRLTVRETASGLDVRRPSFTVGRPGEDARITFAGVPLGHEFTSLALAILQVGGVPPRVDPALAEAVRAIRGPRVFETFVSLSCLNCPEVVQALNALAVLNPAIRHVMVDGALFQDEVASRRIMGVPAVFLDGAAFSQGRTTLEEIVRRLDSGAAAREAAKLADTAPYDVLVVGGGPAGAAAAVYAARKGIRTGLVAERFGGQVGDTLGIENLVAVPYTEGPKLAASLEAQVRQNGVEILAGHRVEALVPAGTADPGAGAQPAPATPPAAEARYHGVRLANGAVLRARTVILAPGARWREMGVPGEAEYRNRGVAFCPHCDGPLFKDKRVAVVGGGNSGVEAAIDLAGIVRHVTLLEFDRRLRADAVLQARLHALPNVQVRVDAQTLEVTGNGQAVEGLIVKDRADGHVERVDVDGVFVQIGLLPGTDWLRGTVALNARGEIEVDAHGRTSIAGIFAAGDATSVPFKQIVIAMGDGAKASLAAFEHLVRDVGVRAA
ncbi:MAG: alkyl hydroperoxide reductase, subunit [Pseudomonadota bacterium]|jgi:alkyl hydroperoxide reductase subunit F